MLRNISQLLPILKKDFPDIKFISGDAFVWSPRNKTVSYSTSIANAEHGVWALLHEIAHAELGHNNYGTDFSLLQLENKAWAQAAKTAINYKIAIDPDHIQDCLDTYRDWLHKRATCPACGVVSLQKKDLTYQCFNCATVWQVPRSPLCRVNRRIVNQHLH